ncbi:MAG TPA: hypothetical protein DCQ56_04600 [Porphyromonadaceae bacterium]|nr:hypothetical protein [Porphyromonadaceae bacterium]
MDAPNLGETATGRAFLEEAQPTIGKNAALPEVTAPGVLIVPLRGTIDGNVIINPMFAAVGAETWVFVK